MCPAEPGSVGRLFSTLHMKVGRAVKGIFVPAAIVVAWVVLMRWLLPRIGVPT